jgi:hypothetical protein
MAVIGPDFPKCPACTLEMTSIPLEKVPVANRREMARYNRYQPLNPNFWYECKGDEIIIHKIAIKAK